MNHNVPFVASTGFNGTGFDLTYAVCQSQVLQSQASAAWTTANTSFSNYQALADVFQEYRIVKWEIDIYFSANAAPTNVTNTGSALPILYAFIDREDARAVTSAPSALQYASCKVMQLGNSSGNHGKQSIVMNRPSCYGECTDASTLLGSPNPATLQYSPWLALGSPTSSTSAITVPHGFIKFYADPEGCTNVTANGTITFIHRVFYEFRGID